MARENPPAIRRRFRSTDRDMTVFNKTYDTVEFIRGLGDSGKRHETVECDCPHCSFDRMYRVVSVSPELDDMVEYYCLNPNCGHYLADRFGYACQGRKMKSEPTEQDSAEA